MKPQTGPVPLTLVCHPQTPSQAIRGVDVVVSWAASGSLSLAFALEADLSRLRIPEPRVSLRTDGLWRHTCFEAFVMAGKGPEYREFNFSPSSEWAAYAFHSYREGEQLGIELNPGTMVCQARDRLELDAEIHRDFLLPGRSLRLGLSAVLEDADGVLSYWALQHPPGKPDFHHTDAFALQLALP